ncbi:DUF5681 domain-containing protein [Alteraurantiacibacter buctensis]|uniref:DUF5681 domain-containing protein n=1 Tax=Alteraurantiacibacter buctensis TaxID=1503981 RepID=A0A844YTR8_9SPHN|nr:DUF5681 domain-containing protein [Alteraurantiacibacter buctensis]MXO70261.1 hypothetical protein [Alteraurantiacibacter buctensis]
MPKRKNPTGDDYEIGYAKPPRATQFVPGQSGFAGRKHKKVEPHNQMISRILNEEVEVSGQKMTKLALVVLQTVNKTIKGGRPQDLKILLEMLEKHGVMTKVDAAEEARIGADEAMAKVSQIFFRLQNADPKLMAASKQADLEEAEIIMGCSHCAPILRERWKTPEYKSRLKQGQKSAIQSEVTGKERNKRLIKIWENLPRDVT